LCDFDSVRGPNAWLGFTALAVAGPVEAGERSLLHVAIHLARTRSWLDQLGGRRVKFEQPVNARIQ
jgi:hypothetical protein